VSTRVRTFASFAATTVMALAPSLASAQGQSEPPTTRGYCVKVAPGKGAEFRALLHDVGVPINQALANAGDFEWFVALRSVVPAGSSAACDYRMVAGYKGLPPEPTRREAFEAATKAAKVNMTWDQFVAKRNSLASLVSTEIWQGIDVVGPDATPGSYVRINHYKVKDGAFGDWVRLEQAIWKPVMEAWLKEGGKGSWRVSSLMMPSGDVMPYNALTVDIFPDWNGLVRDPPLDTLWPKVHPNLTTEQAFEHQLPGVRSIHDIEVYQVEEVVRPKL
jgi:hypothetical protein